MCLILAVATATIQSRRVSVTGIKEGRKRCVLCGLMMNVDKRNTSQNVIRRSLFDCHFRELISLLLLRIKILCIHNDEIELLHISKTNYRLVATTSNCARDLVPLLVFVKRQIWERLLARIVGRQHDVIGIEQGEGTQGFEVG